MKTPPFPVVLASFSLLAVAVSGCSSGSAGSASGRLREEYESKRATHVVVAISANDRVRVDDERSSPKELAAALKTRARVHPGRPVLLLVRKDTKPDAITFVKKRALEAGLGPVEVMVVE